MDTLADILQQDIKKHISDVIQESLQDLAVSDAVTDFLKDRIRDPEFRKILKGNITKQIDNHAYIDASISPNIIDWSDFKLPVDNISGLLKTSGLEDHSSKVELTLLDDNVVVEGTLTANKLSVKELEIQDSFDVTAKWFIALRDNLMTNTPSPVMPSYDSEIAELQNRISILSSNTNHLKDLEVTGEASLSDVLYTTPGNKRVGINTMDPSDALTIWDNEVEVVVGKHQSQEGFIGTRRRQDLNIGANNTVGMKVKIDGTVQVHKLQLMNRTIAESKTIPDYAAKRGDIVLNAEPAVGAAIGWVCLDGLKWAKWGTIG